MNEVKYNLVDIHFHTDISFDGNENGDFSIEKVKKILTSGEKVNMIAFTDHNIFYYDKYIERKAILDNEITLLPGIEMNIKGFHWIFIFNDDNEEKLKKVSKELLKLFTYEDFETVIANKEKLRALGEKNFEIEEILDVLFRNRLDFIAIPHGDKSKGYFKKYKNDIDKINEELKDLISENIVFGFESKYNSDYYKEQIKKINKKIEHASTHEMEEGCKQQLENIQSLQKEYSSLANVFGSDFHNRNKNSFDDYEITKKELFYIKAKPTFYGLKMSLLDVESRVYSKEQYKKAQKEGLETFIKSIKINDSQELIFGDGLNCIIGSRGSGKSYLYKAILGKIDAYKNSPIFNNIKITKVKLGNGQELKQLDNNLYDEIKQKSSNKSEDDNEINIYELLSDAPYSQEFFLEEVENYAKKTIEKEEINDYFEIINNYLKSFEEYINDKDIIKKDSMLNDKIKRYNEYIKVSGKDKNINIQIIELIGKYTKRIQEARVQLYNIKEILNKYDEIEEIFSNNLKDIYEGDDLKQHIENQKAFINKIKQIEKEKNEKYIKLEIINNKLKVIRDNMKNENSNYDEAMNELYNELNTNINNLKTKYKEIRELRKKIKINKDKEFINKTEYAASKQNIKFLTIQKFIFKELKDEQIREMFENYKISEPVEDIIEFILNAEKLLEIRDKRKKSIEIKIPQIQFEIIIKTNKEEEDFNKLSPGQRAEVLLGLVFDESTNKILFLDQPEDDLDNIAIQKVIVNKIRQLKKTRQIFVVTHNANICFNADADTVIICEKDGNEFKFCQYVLEEEKKVDYNKIDIGTINERPIIIASEILEGGKEALRKRVQKIGYQDLVYKEEHDGEKENNI